MSGAQTKQNICSAWARRPFYISAAYIRSLIVGEDAVRPYLTDLAVAEAIIATAAPIMTREKA